MCNKSAKKFLPVTLLFVSACQSSGSSDGDGKVANLDVFKGVVETQIVKLCTHTSSSLKIPSRVSSAKVIWNESNEPQLLYQGAFRDAIKTVLQPLSKSLDIQGDGIVLGPPGNSYVTDFNFVKDVKNQTWSSFRLRNAQTHAFEAHVEYLAKGSDKLVRVPLPNLESYSVQQVWLLPRSHSGFVNVVVRAADIGTEQLDDSDRSTFIWFVVNGEQKLAVKKGEHINKGNTLSSVSFVNGEGDEPTAFAVKQNQQQLEVTNLKRQRSIFRVVKKQMFSTGNELLITETHVAIGSLTVAKSSIDSQSSTHVAWLEESGSSVNGILKWATLGIQQTQPTKKRAAPVRTKNGKKAWTHARELLNSGPPRALLLASKELQLRYFPSYVRFRSIPGPNGAAPSLVLTWSVSLDAGVGYLFSKVSPPGHETEITVGRDKLGKAKKKSVPQVFAVFAPDAKGQLVGIGESQIWGRPDLLVIAAPNQEAPVTYLNMCSF